MWNRSFVAMLIVALMSASAGCDGPRAAPTRPGLPDAQPPVTPVVPANTVMGTVYDTAFRRVAGATVEVLDGPHAGMIATTAASGEFVLSGTFDQSTRFRAAGAGYLPATMLHPHGHIDFYLVSSTPPVNVAGEYELTFMTDPSCTGIPESVRTRTYEASIRPGSFARIPAGMAFDLALHGLDALDNPAIGVAGKAVGFRLYNDGYPFIVERVAPDLYLTITGWAEVAAWSDARVVAVPFEGWIAAAAGPPGSPSPVFGNCRSTDHRLEIRRN